MVKNSSSFRWLKALYSRTALPFVRAYGANIRNRMILAKKPMPSNDAYTRICSYS